MQQIHKKRTTHFFLKIKSLSFKEVLILYFCDNYFGSVLDGMMHTLVICNHGLSYIGLLHRVDRQFSEGSAGVSLSEAAWIHYNRILDFFSKWHDSEDRKEERKKERKKKRKKEDKITYKILRKYS